MRGDWESQKKNSMTENKAHDYAIFRTNVRVVSGNESGRQSSYIDNLAIDPMNQKTLPFYRNESFLLYLLAQIVVCLAVVHIYLQRGSPPAPILLIVLLLFSALLWLLPKNNPRQTYLYLAIQSSLACLLFIQDFLFVYLFFILASQSIILFRTRDGLIWFGVFVVITLYGTFHPYTADLSNPPPIRAVLISSGFIFSGLLSNGIARARRDQKEIEYLLTRLQESTDQSRMLAVAEKRNRLARELHDTLGHKMTVSIVQVEGASRLIEQEPQRVARMLKTVQMQLTDGLTELRYTLKELRTTNSNGNAPSRSQQRIADEGELERPNEKTHD